MPIEVIPNRLVGLAIEAEPARLERLAQAAQAAWFADPDNPSKKRDFAWALDDWARATGNTTAKQHAARLLEETAQLPTETGERTTT